MTANWRQSTAGSRYLEKDLLCQLEMLVQCNTFIGDAAKLVLTLLTLPYTKCFSADMTITLLLPTVKAYAISITMLDA